MRMLSARSRLLVTASLLIASAFCFSADSTDSTASDDSKKKRKDVERVSVDEARRQAKLLHTSMHAALQLMHHRYYREDAGLPIPAAVTKDVFAELADESPVTLRWLVVEGQAMNTDHLAQSEFEKQAVAALTAGQNSVEEVEDGMYRRAGPISLTSHCLKCHVPDRKSTRDRKAGLIVSIPVSAE